MLLTLAFTLAANCIEEEEGNFVATNSLAIATAGCRVAKEKCVLYCHADSFRAIFSHSHVSDWICRRSTFLGIRIDAMPTSLVLYRSHHTHGMELLLCLRTHKVAVTFINVDRMQSIDIGDNAKMS